MTVVQMLLASNTLVGKMGVDSKTLTLKLDFETLAEFSAARKILGARSNSTLINQFIIQKIREAKGLVSATEFAETVERQKGEIIKRSEMKSAERKKITSVKNKPKSLEKVAVAQNKTRKSTQTLSTGTGRIPLVDEAASAESDEEQ